jgi:DNA-binding CsgD family transcriptional regulator
MKNPLLGELTPREMGVLHWLAEGKSSWETGKIIDCAAATVKKHRDRNYATLGVANAIGAAEVYWRSTK